MGGGGMKFWRARMEGDEAKLPMVTVKLPQELREKIGRVDPKKKLIAGIRPEDFEDAGHVAADVRERGTTFKTSFDLVEAMGAEYYVHFSVAAAGVQGAQVDALLQDQGGITEIGDEGKTVG